MLVPPDRMIDLAPVGRQLASGMLAVAHEQRGRPPGTAGEESLATPHVGHHAVGVDHDPADVTGDGRTEHIVGMERHA